MNVVVTCRLPADVPALFSDFTLTYHDTDAGIDRDTLAASVADAHGLVSMLSDPIDAAIIDAAPNLKIIANYAVGYNNIDVEYAHSKGITVTNTPHVLTESTAELGFGLMMAAGRRIAESDAFTRQGKFTGWEPSLFLGRDLFAKRLGIFGMGRIGQAVARMAVGFSMDITYHNRSRDRQGETLTGARYVGFDELVSESDFIIITAPLNDATKHRFTAKEFSLMKDSAVLVNIGRGPIVKEDDLADALTSGDIFAAGLDVYEFEPKIAETLKTLPNAVLAPHIGSADVDTRRRMAELCADAVKSVLVSGKTPWNAL